MLLGGLSVNLNHLMIETRKHFSRVRTAPILIPGGSPYRDPLDKDPLDKDPLDRDTSWTETPLPQKYHGTRGGFHKGNEQLICFLFVIFG